MYKPNADTANWEAPPGVGPWRDLSDEEFAELNTASGGGLERWFDKVPDKKSKAKGGDQ